MRRLVLAAVLLAACGNQGNATYDNPAEPVRVRAGSEFTLVVQSNPSTGYEWVLMDSAALGPLQFVSKDYSERDASDPRATGVERWVFRAPTAGSGIVTLVYQRPGPPGPVGALAQFNVFVR
jgi:predicted secreted protein